MYLVVLLAFLVPASQHSLQLSHRQIKRLFIQGSQCALFVILIVIPVCYARRHRRHIGVRIHVSTADAWLEGFCHIMSCCHSRCHCRTSPYLPVMFKAPLELNWRLQVPLNHADTQPGQSARRSTRGPWLMYGGTRYGHPPTPCCDPLPLQLMASAATLTGPENPLLRPFAAGNDAAAGYIVR